MVYMVNFSKSNVEKEQIKMKQVAVNNSADMLHKIESIEKEIKGLKLSVLKKLTPSGKKVAKLKGIFKGVTITEEDIVAAKKSLYSKTGI
jgi:hypothetical protein